MTRPLHTLWIAGLIAGCTSASPLHDKNLVPDGFDNSDDILQRSLAHPCRADLDNGGDGIIDLRSVFAYDAQGRIRGGVTTQPDGTIVGQDDYTWDNAGHVIETDHIADGYKDDEQFTYDALGRRLEYRYTASQDDVPLSRQVITYSAFDELGHPARGGEVVDNLADGTSRTRARSYGYDQFGRRISVEVRDAAGNPTQSFTYVFDDDARTVTTTVNSPIVIHTDGQPDTMSSSTQRIVDTYDAENHLIASHVVNSIDGRDGTISDTHNLWSGDRQLSSTTTSNAPGAPSPQTTTYHYDCAN